MVIEPTDFVPETASDGRDEYGWMNRNAVVDGIKKFLSAIEDGRALISSIELTTIASAGDYGTCTLTFKYAEGPSNEK